MKPLLWFGIAVGAALVLRAYWRANATEPDHQRDRNPMVKPTTTVYVVRMPTDPIDNEAE